MNNMHSIYKNLTRIVCLLTVLLILFSGSCLATERQKIRVGWFYQPSYQETTSSGQPYGYNYEYLMQLAQHTNWDYEFILVDSFMSGYEMIKKEKLDLLGYVLYLDKRAQEVSFPKLSSGNVSTSLFVRRDSDIAPYDFEVFDGMKVACMPSQNPLYLLDYARENSFSVKLIYYNSTDQVQGAVRNKDVDAGVLGGYQSSKDTRIIASFMPAQFYFVTGKHNTEVLKKLNMAQSLVKLDNPLYEQELAYKYLPEIKDIVHFTQAEKKYIEKHPTLAVSYYKSWWPIEATDPSSGAFVGIVADVFARVSDISGIKFEYKETTYFASKETKAPIIADFYHDFAKAEREGYMLTKSYLKIPMVSIRKKDDQEFHNRIAAVFEREYSPEELAGFGNVKLNFFKSTEECLDAVLNGQADIAYINAYIADYMLSQQRYKALKSSIMHKEGYDVAIAVDKEMDPILCSILNKSLNKISSAEINAIILKNTTKPSTLNIQTIIEQMPADVLLLVTFVLVSMIGILIFIMHKQAKHSERIKQILHTDELTGILSFKGFEYKARKAIDNNTGSKIFIIDFDINHFGAYNTINGYHAGNELLRTLARNTEKIFDTKGLCARIQADHFVCLAFAHSIDNIFTGIEIHLKELRKVADMSSMLVSYGIYEIVNSDQGIINMCDCALIAKNAVKGNYERNVAVYDEYLHKIELENVSILGNFEKALEAGELIAYYQPQYDIHTKQIVSAEALVRWFPQNQAVMMPMQFIDLLEKNSFIGKLDLYMFELVCRKITAMLQENKKTVPIAVNLSRVHLYDVLFIEKLKSIAQEYAVPTSAIEIEITETAFMDNQREAKKIIDLLHKAGFLVALDDFGSGFSSLNMLKDLKFDILKLDRGFLSKNSKTDRDEKIIKNIISLARDLNMRTVAEGIETKEQYDLLKRNGCDIVQGYYFSRPIPEDEFDRLLGN